MRLASFTERAAGTPAAGGTALTRGRRASRDEPVARRAGTRASLGAARPACARPGWSSSSCALRRDELCLALLPDLGEHAGDDDGLRRRGHRRRRHDHPADLGRHRPVGRLGRRLRDGAGRLAVPAGRRSLDRLAARHPRLAPASARRWASSSPASGSTTSSSSLAFMVIVRGALPALHRRHAARRSSPCRRSSSSSARARSASSPS